MAKRKVIIETTKQNEDGLDIGRTSRKAFWLSNEDGSNMDDLDVKDWFEDTYPIEDSERIENGFIGYKITNTGFVKYVLTFA